VQALSRGRQGNPGNEGGEALEQAVRRSCPEKLHMPPLWQCSRL